MFEEPTHLQWWSLPRYSEHCGGKCGCEIQSLAGYLGAINSRTLWTSCWVVWSVGKVDRNTVDGKVSPGPVHPAIAGCPAGLERAPMDNWLTWHRQSIWGLPNLSQIWDTTVQTPHVLHTAPKHALQGASLSLSLFFLFYSPHVLRITENWTSSQILLPHMGMEGFFQIREIQLLYVGDSEAHSISRIHWISVGLEEAKHKWAI